MRKTGLYKSVAYFITDCTCYDMEPWQYESKDLCFNEVLNDIKTGGAAGLLSGMYDYILDVDDDTQTKHIAVATGMLKYYLETGMLYDRNETVYNRFTFLFHFPDERKIFKMFVYASDRNDALKTYKRITGNINTFFFAK